MQERKQMKLGVAKAVENELPRKTNAKIVKNDCSSKIIVLAEVDETKHK